MRGRVPMRPLTEVADAAVRVFTEKGFRPAGVTDVAAALGLSHGAIYTYARSKQALLYLALLRVLSPDSVADLTPPVAAPDSAEIIAIAEKWAFAHAALPALEMALTAEPADRPVAEELGAIVAELYDFLERNRPALHLVERCAGELPEVAQWYFVGRRRTLLAALVEYLTSRIAAGRLHPVPDVPVAARFVVETIAWFTLHRPGDADSAMLADEDCRRTVRHLLVTAFPAPH
jgi:AcrR family transcriptional regulator